MTLYTVAQNTAQEAYNDAYAKARVVIEQTFGQMKTVFHVLHTEIRIAPEKVFMILGACAERASKLPFKPKLTICYTSYQFSISLLLLNLVLAIKKAT